MMLGLDEKASLDYLKRRQAFFMAMQYGGVQKPNAVQEVIADAEKIEKYLNGPAVTNSEQGA